MTELKYPIGVQNFRNLRESGYVYIDKTGYIEKLIENPYRTYFLSRPRRFGKSLFLSTLESFFRGERELFKGLRIDRDDVDWTPRPVLRLDLSPMDATSLDSLNQVLEYHLTTWEAKYGKPSGGNSYAMRFYNAIRSACQKSGQQVAVLVDEYDAPILLSLEDRLLNDQVRDVLQSFYKVLKSASEYVKYCFITGVSRFTHTTIFSGLNNLKDISDSPDYGGICGITEAELKDNLMPGIRDFAKAQDMDVSEVFETLKYNYDGYHFAEGSADIYNPFSLLNALDEKKIGAYWFRTATPSYLVAMLRHRRIQLPSLQEGCFIPESQMSVADPHLANPLALMYQTGYLTIKSHDDFMEGYWLKFPNREVERGFIENLLPLYYGTDREYMDDSLHRLKLNLLRGESEEFMEDLRSVLAELPADREEIRHRELYFENKLYVILKMLGFDVRTQQGTSFSRMDMVIRMPGRIYVMELKVDRSPEEALRQIDEKDYALPFLHYGLSVVKVGINYSSRTNNIDGWIISGDEID